MAADLAERGVVAEAVGVDVGEGGVSRHVAARAAGLEVDRGPVTECIAEEVVEQRFDLERAIAAEA